MIADFVVLGGLILFALIGIFVGFGSGLKFFTSGIFGVAISAVVCYAFGAMLLEFQFVQDLLNRLASLWSGEGNFFFDFLSRIRFDIVLYYLILFVAVQIVRIIIVAILKRVVEIDFILIKIINKALGMVLFAVVYALIVLVVFQIVAWVGGSTAESFLGYFDGSFLKLDVIFINNPLSNLQGFIESLALS